MDSIGFQQLQSHKRYRPATQRPVSCFPTVSLRNSVALPVGFCQRTPSGRAFPASISHRSCKEQHSNVPDMLSLSHGIAQVKWYKSAEKNLCAFVYFAHSGGLFGYRTGRSPIELAEDKKQKSRSLPSLSATQMDGCPHPFGYVQPSMDIPTG